MVRLVRPNTLAVVGTAFMLLASMACAGGGGEEPATPAPAAPAATAVGGALTAQSSQAASPQAPAAASAPQKPAAPMSPAAPAAAATIGSSQSRTGTTQAPSGTAPVVAYKASTQVPGKAWAYINEYSPRPTKFNENPKFAALVKQGKLPPLEQRLPVAADIFVFAPPDEIGTYGGVARVVSGNASPFVKMENLAGSSFCMHPDANYLNFYPTACKSVTTSADGRVYTIKLRQGLKWSDGTPFTMQDVAWVWSEDLNYNKELNPLIPTVWQDPVTANPPKFTRVDDWTFTLTFDSPMFTLFDAAGFAKGSGCTGFGSCIFEPFHFSKKFHPKYADPEALKKLMAERGYTTWVQLWNNKYALRYDANIPMLAQFYVCNGGGANAQQEDLCANPYFWGVDPAGNQLPYLDGYSWLMTTNRDVAVFRAMSGETDGPLTDGFLLQEMPLYLSNMEKGDYSIGHWVETSGNDAGIQVNAEYNDDAELGRWFRTKEFREALSLAMDRSTINEVQFLGLGTPQAWIPEPNTPFSPGSSWQNYMAVRDVTAAKKRLTGLGLVDKDNDGYVDRLDGKGALEIYSEFRPNFVPTVLVIQQQWKEVGIKLTFKEGANAAYDQGKAPIRMRSMPTMTNPWVFTQFVPYRSSSAGTEMGRYFETRGAQGMAPVGAPIQSCPTCSKNEFLPQAPAGNYPADPEGFLMKMQNLYRDGQGYAMLDPKRIEDGKMLFTLNLQHTFHLGSVGYGDPGIMIKRNNIRNVPNQHNPIYPTGLGSMLYYFEDGVDNLNHSGNRSKKYHSVSFLSCANVASDKC